MVPQRLDTITKYGSEDVMRTLALPVLNHTNCICISNLLERCQPNPSATEAVATGAWRGTRCA